MRATGDKWAMWRNWRRPLLTVATALVFMISLVSGVGAIGAHAAAKEPAVVGCRSVAQEKAFLLAHGQQKMADHVTSVSCGGTITHGGKAEWGLATGKGSWGGYISDTTGQTNTNQDFGEYVLRSSSNNFYPTGEWVGIGGFAHGAGNVALLQGGVDLSNNEMWWEAVKADGTDWGRGYDTGWKGTVNDTYSTVVARTGVGIWEVDSEEFPSGHVFDSGSLGFSPDHTSAEWVMEWQGLGSGGYVPSLSASVPFTDVYFDDINYTQHNVAYASTYYQEELDYTSGGGSCIKAGTLTNDTSTYSHFTDSWANSGC